MKLGIGTAQFGSHYGISNRTGKPSEKEIAAILAYAAETEINYIDTAAAYGDAEILIGRHLPRGHKARITTKCREAREIRRSLDRLQTDKVYGIFIHGIEYVTEGNIEALTQARARGWVERIGVSVYTTKELELAENKFRVELLQMPFNITNIELAGVIQRLKSKGVEIHARSIFKQGALLMNGWPLEACIKCILRPGIDAAIVGVNWLSELKQVEATVARLIRPD